MARQAGAGAPAGAEAVVVVGRPGGVQGGVPEGAEQLGPLVRMRQHPEAVEGPQGACERRGGGGGRAGPDPQVGVVVERQVGRERVGEVPRGGRVAHHVGVEGGVGGVRPRHGEALALVLHPAVLEPHLQRIGGGTMSIMTPLN